MPDAPRLPEAFFKAPLAHRALHDILQGRVENSTSAVQAAVEAGYGIEIDLQLSADGEAMVFHDDTLDRLTGETGRVRTRSTTELGRIPLVGSMDLIPTLTEILEIVAGQVPLLIEIKDQDGALGPETGQLERRTCALVKDYKGPVALMSFNPHAVAICAQEAPNIPRGLTTESFDADDWGVDPDHARCLSEMQDLDRVGASFISHDHKDLGSNHVARAKATGCDVLCWTIRSQDQADSALRVARNITFEGYRPATG